jgi:hypothetical protein
MHQSLRRSAMCWPGARSLSYVARARLLEKMKSDDKFCASQLQSGQFLLYHRGRPLLGQGEGGRHQPAWLRFPAALRLSPGLEGSVAALAVSGEGVVRFAVELDSGLEPSQAEEEGTGRFTDLRSALFLVDGEVAHSLSRSLETNTAGN